MMNKYIIIILIIIFVIVVVDNHVKNKVYRYIETGKDNRRWVSKDEYDILVKQSGCMVPNFIDLTNLYYKTDNFYKDVIDKSFQYRMERSVPKDLIQQDLFELLVQSLDIKNIEYIIKTLSSLHTRYYTSDQGGSETSEIIYNYIDSIIGNQNCTVEYFNHLTSPIQKSVIAKIKGSESDESVIYCAHIDSINTKVNEDERNTARSPGADDNATGVANVLEVFRILSTQYPKKTLEFHFYAGEEQGLRGSAEIAEFYKLQNRKVMGILNNDMTGFTEDGVTAYIVNGENDFVDAELVDFCIKLAEKYSSLILKGGICGYACSDHASWGRYGYPSACISEATPKAGKLNPHNHTETDDISNISLPYTYQHARIGLGFMIENGF
jgi:bacterial leucyl aminopeptidase